MKSINWTKPANAHVDPPIDPTKSKTRERPQITEEILHRDELRDSAEFKVLRNIARTYARYYGPTDG